MLSSASLIEDHTTALQRNESLRDSYHHQQLGNVQTVSKILNALSKPERMKRFLSENPRVSSMKSAIGTNKLKAGMKQSFRLERKPVTSLFDELLEEEKEEQKKEEAKRKE